MPRTFISASFFYVLCFCIKNCYFARHAQVQICEIVFDSFVGQWSERHHFASHLALSSIPFSAVYAVSSFFYSNWIIITVFLSGTLFLVWHPYLRWPHYRWLTNSLINLAPPKTETVFVGDCFIVLWSTCILLLSANLLGLFQRSQNLWRVVTVRMRNFSWDDRLDVQGCSVSVLKTENPVMKEEKKVQMMTRDNRDVTEAIRDSYKIYEENLGSLANA